MFVSEVGDMLGEVRLAPAILFYLLYIVGIVVFANGSATANLAVHGTVRRIVRTVLLRDLRADLDGVASSTGAGAVVAVDVSWGVVVTATLPRQGAFDRELARAADITASFRGDAPSIEPGNPEVCGARFPGSMLSHRPGMTTGAISAAARSGYRAFPAISSPADRWSWPRHR